MSDPNVNIKKFKKWCDSLKLKDFIPHVNLTTRKLIKTHVAKNAGFGYSALKKENGNPHLLKLFDEFEDKLMSALVAEGFLPELDESQADQGFDLQNSEESGILKVTASANTGKTKELEEENYALRNKIKVLEQKLKDSDISNERHRETIQVINEINGVL
ncbi:hypothetical protein [Pseudoalteromonas sp. G24-MNA-CIBAN-0072]|uniref:hypothetical protein n=1 Tax=Pseudoalteromonas sp. G24-MNA-CIBAN-0072 TaxID=3140418 RepID=UPI003324E36F